MPPAGLLAIIALGLVLAYVVPQKIRERTDYALVRTEDRYSADMRVVRSSAQRLERPRQSASYSGEVPLLVTGAARAQVSALGADHMSRPAGPLDRAATAAQRERIALHRDQAGVRAQRAAAAQRRARVASAVAAITVIAWVLVAATPVPALVAGLATGALVTVVVLGARTAAAERRADRDVRLVAREVSAAATATQALRVVAQARAQGLDAQPSDTATQAIRVVTAEDLAPLAAPAPRPVARTVQQAPLVDAGAWDGADAGVGADAGAGSADEPATSPWSPKTMPVPAYALKPQVRQQVARPLREEDFAASAVAAERAARAAAAAQRAAALQDPQGGAEAATASGALDAILARRRATAS